MDRRYAAAPGGFAHLEGDVHGIQRLRFNQEMLAANILEKQQYAIAAFTLMLIVSTTYYGFRFTKIIAAS